MSAKVKKRRCVDDYPAGTRSVIKSTWEMYTNHHGDITRSARSPNGLGLAGLLRNRTSRISISDMLMDIRLSGVMHVSRMGATCFSIVQYTLRAMYFQALNHLYCSAMLDVPRKNTIILKVLRTTSYIDIKASGGEAITKGFGVFLLGRIGLWATRYTRMVHVGGHVCTYSSKIDCFSMLFQNIVVQLLRPKRVHNTHRNRDSLFYWDHPNLLLDIHFCDFVIKKF